MLDHSPANFDANGVLTDLGALSGGTFSSGLGINKCRPSCGRFKYGERSLPGPVCLPAAILHNVTDVNTSFEILACSDSEERLPTLPNKVARLRSMIL